MSAKGKHRRIKLSRLTRIAVATGVAGASLALPVTAASAHGTDSHQSTAPAASTTTKTSIDAIEVKPVAETTSAPAPAASAARSYDVVSGDTLSKIADAQQVGGGWQKLYEDNRSVVGSNPNLIFPGQHLSLSGKAAAAAPQAATPKQEAPKQEAPKPSTAKAAAPKASSSSSAAKSSTASSSDSVSSSSAVAASSGYTAPVSSRITTGYGVAGSSWSSGHHTGVDFPVSTGTSVKAIAAGTVVSAGSGGAYGNEVVIKHADGKYSQYAHLSSISVRAGQTVTVGQQIGLSGATGNASGPHLHFEVRTGPAYGSDIDPVAYLASHGVKI
ncbi:M23 family metallopeptidase [Kitasatospora atroaurantiaca]|uniref:Murein DD-endopeptidase MepM/ murein hydrolase activator NlpD n=1 Tax=Kitasatospora atroaurantiaca TaxID=285545 RepID=A0A561ENZ5_9ACTN|nr:peptidoglycan DD-metalloendopeptidase family protein [Kitasatospora atroaurantiaca]TWE17343.1 murein DD-endopeptidase MepM/ murein hydrolase activator NlpD [Kitasatospora atroaurantiaca]